MSQGAKHEQRVLAASAVLAAVLLGVYWIYVVQPLLSNTMALERSIRDENQQLQQTRQLAAQRPALQQEYDQLSEGLKSLRELLPGEQELSAVIEQLSGIATRAGVKIQTIFPQRSLESFKAVAGLQEGNAPQSKLVKEIPIQIDALAGYHQLGAFLARVERGKQPMMLKSLRITGSAKEPKRQAVEMVLIAYFAVSEQQKPGAVAQNRSEVAHEP